MIGLADFSSVVKKIEMSDSRITLDTLLYIKCDDIGYIHTLRTHAPIKKRLVKVRDILNSITEGFEIVLHEEQTIFNAHEKFYFFLEAERYKFEVKKDEERVEKIDMIMSAYRDIVDKKIDDEIKKEKEEEASINPFYSTKTYSLPFNMLEDEDKFEELRQALFEKTGKGDPFETKFKKQTSFDFLIKEEDLYKYSDIGNEYDDVVFV